MMTPELTRLLLDELDDLEIRVAVQVQRLPGDAEVAQLQHDISRQRAAVVDALAQLREASPTANIH